MVDLEENQQGTNKRPRKSEPEEFEKTSWNHFQAKVEGLASTPVDGQSPGSVASQALFDVFAELVLNLRQGDERRNRAVVPKTPSTPVPAEKGESEAEGMSDDEPFAEEIFADSSVLHSLDMSQPTQSAVGGAS